jgi:tetratricopeptide (TPR) repeat protein
MRSRARRRATTANRGPAVSKSNMRQVLVALLLLAAGCASAPLRQADRLRLADADTRLLDGCLACLREARETYEDLADGAARPLLLPRLFEVNILIALREGELAIPASAAIDRATAIAAELPASPVRELALELAHLGLPEVTGTPRAAARRRTRDLLALSDRFAGQIPPVLQDNPTGDPFITYLARSWTCLPGVKDESPAGEPAQEITDASLRPGLLAYREATCPLADAEALDALVERIPDFVEAGYLRARLPALAFTAEYVARQREWFERARQAFPTSAAVTYSFGALNQTLGDCRTALTYYDATLRIQPAHEEAALQRVVCLGFLGRFETAVNAATAIIDASYFNADDAYYWRAWNRNELRQREDARADIEQALKMRANARNYSLAGIIAYHLQDLEAASRHLSRSIDMDRTMCLSRWYLGLVSFEREEWAETGAAFEAAADCYKASADEARQNLADIEVADLDAEFKRNQIIGFTAVIQEDTSQEHASCINGANGYLRAGDRERAAQLITRIPGDSDYAPGAAQIREYLAELTDAEIPTR